MDTVPALILALTQKWVCNHKNSKHKRHKSSGFPLAHFQSCIRILRLILDEQKLQHLHSTGSSWHQGISPGSREWQADLLSAKMIHSCSLKQKAGGFLVLVWLFVVGLNCRKQLTEIGNFCWEDLGHRCALELYFYHLEKLHCPVSRCSASADDQQLKSQCQP